MLCWRLMPPKLLVCLAGSNYRLPFSPSWEDRLALTNPFSSSGLLVRPKLLTRSDAKPVEGELAASLSEPSLLIMDWTR